MYLFLTLLHHGCAIVLMSVGIQWGAIGIAYAEVAVTYLLIAPRLYYTFKDSPMTIGAFLSAIACPVTASIVMALGLMFLRQLLPAIGAPALLSIAAATGFVIFVGVWLLLPGGGRQLFELFSDLRLALERKPARVNSVSVPGAPAPL